MMSLTQKTQDQIWSALVLFPTGAVCLFYVLFKRDFAKIHFNFSFLNFPIFPGEILLSWCLLLLILFSIKRHPKLHFLVFIYLFWFAIKVVRGYCIWGPLAFRHAALFYYPCFSLIGYVFFNRTLFIKPVNIFLCVMIAAVYVWAYFDRYWTLSLACLGIILILGIKEKNWAWILGLILVALIPYVSLFSTARMMFVSNLASLAFLAVACLCLLRVNVLFKLGAVVLLLAVISFGFYKFFILGESGRMYTSPQKVIEQFRQTDEIIQARRSTFIKTPLRTDLFNPKYDKIQIIHKNPGPFCSSTGKKNPGPIPTAVTCTKTIEVRTPLSQDRNFIEWQSVSNIVFRLVIWRDMWMDWKSQKPLWGFDFGRPLRSPSLEVLHWAESEWGRDGWIEPHNSYFNVLYRSGIVGIVLVVSMWLALGWYIKQAFARRSWVMILLSAILMNWMIAANFLLIFELPYTAIPFWTIAGMAFAYALKNNPEGPSYATKR